MKRKRLAGAVVATIGGLAMTTSIASATATVTPLEGETVNYTLNGNEKFSAGVLQIDDGETKIFILDRNLGATAAGTGCKDPFWSSACPANDPTYGYHFQWGNNYGFDPNSTPSTRTTQVQATSLIYDPLHQKYYSGSQFFIDEGDEYGNWLDDNSVVDLWGGSTDDYINSLDGDNWQVNNASDRQGPCPENFHVPSYGELNKIKTMMGNDAAAVHSELLVPFAGLRLYDNASVFLLGNYLQLWSSSPDSASNPTSHGLNLGDGTMDMAAIYRAYALSVRCIHNFYQTYTKPNEDTAQILVIIDAGSVTIGVDTGASGSRIKNLGAVTVSNSDQILSGGFGSGSFWIEDMKGATSGYYTTLSVSDLSGDTTSRVIGKENVRLKPTAVSFISGAAVNESKVVLGANDTWNDWMTGDVVLTYFNRQNTAVNQAGRVGRWGDDLQVKVNIPAHTVADTYRGTITYTLYDLDQ